MLGKPKYHAKPTEREKAFHCWLMDTFPCACGCGAPSTCVHHPLQRHPEQRWRRDHEYVVPMDSFCHMRLHRYGSEKAFQPGRNYADLACYYRARGIEGGWLDG